MKAVWVGGNEARLLENGEQFYPRVLEAIARARRQVLIETFILFEDKVGRELQRVLIGVARRGVEVDLSVDGYGSSDLTPAFLTALTEAGVRVHIFDPRPKILGYRRNLFRRMHRKIVVVDAEVAFVGGINFSAEHLADFGPMAKQDYAVEVRGPIVAPIHHFAGGMLPRERRRTLRELLGGWLQRRRELAAHDERRHDGVLAAFVIRDNGTHRNDIEHQYRVAFRAARSHVHVANAYFFPGYRLLRDMRRAARRGVRVSLILQGEPDMPIVRIAARMLYEHLLRAGVRIHEYCERPLHAKVAVVDDEWATVGSSNLDPLSLSLNLEANLMLRDRDFAIDLRERLDRLIREHCESMRPGISRNPGLWRFIPGFVVFHFLRRFPSWASWLPAHEPRLKTVDARARALHGCADAARTGAAPARGIDHGQPARRRILRWGARLLFVAFLALVALLAWRQARTVDWSEVLATLRDYRARTLIAALALAAASYTVYGCFDVLGRRYVGAKLPDRRTLLIGAVSYAFNLNLGSIVGGAGFRIRLYSRLGVENVKIAGMIAFSVATNWIGYLLVAGIVFASGAVQFPEGWKAGDGMMRIIGAGMVAAGLGYLALCRFSPRRELRFRGRSFILPSAATALLQAALGASNWLVIASVAWVLLGREPSYATVLGVVCVASIAGALAHIPGGLGVIEGVYVAMLGWSIGVGAVLAAVLAYRVVYYLMPLAVASVLFLVFEWLARHGSTAGFASTGMRSGR